MSNRHNLAWKPGLRTKEAAKKVIGVSLFGFGEILRNQTGLMAKGGDSLEGITVKMLETVDGR